MSLTQLILRPALLLAALLLAAAGAAAQDVLLKNAWIVDPAAHTVEHGSIVLHGAAITAVTHDAPATFNGEVIDLEGKYVMPLLYDMHVHSSGNIAPATQFAYLGPEDIARKMLYCGVGGLLDLFSPEDQILGLRDRQRRQGVPGADIYAAGPILTCPGGHGTEYGQPTRTMSTPAEAERQVNELAVKKPDVVKIVYDHAANWMPTIDRATMEAAVHTATARGLKTVIHIGTWTDAREAIDAGATCITHTYMAEVIPDDLVRLMRDKGVYETPTVAVQSELLNMALDPSLLQRPLLKSVTTPELLGAYRDTARFDQRSKAWLAWQRRGNVSLMASVKKMSDGGVKLLAGTDVGNIATFQGYSLHREIELMVHAGLSSWQAIEAATTRAGEFLGKPVGIRAGNTADLLVLDASPVTDITNTERIAMVIQRGVRIDRDALLHPGGASWTHDLLDDFTATTMHTASGAELAIQSDSAFGGGSSVVVERRGGTVRVHGKLRPGAGRPGIAGLTLMLDSVGTPYNVSAYTGVRLRFRVDKGPVWLRLMSTAVKNYDFHSVQLSAKPGMKTIDIPFASASQLFSAPVPWTGTDMIGLGLWAMDMSPGDYDFTIDSIELYRAGQ